MPWSLAIHHIDVVGSGDSTLIIARERNAHGNTITFRAVLIDGGLLTHGPTVGAYVNTQLGNRQVNVVVCTHYDKDHVGGLCNLLLQPVRYHNACCYDQGWPGAGDAMDDWYTRYARAVSGYVRDGSRRPATLPPVNRTRPTNQVQAGGLAPAMPITAYHAPTIGGLINQPAEWLVNREIMWAPNPVPLGAPEIRCIAANARVAQHGGGVSGQVGGNGADPRNERSLAFKITFNNFRYYVGGDLEQQQEDALRTYLNNANNDAGRVQAMKASHHGANTSSSATFINRLRPEVVFISCGTNNQYGHPHQPVTNRLDVANISHYLTGDAGVNYLGANAYIAGDANTFGHIVLNVSQAQSLRPPTSNHAGGIFTVSYNDANAGAIVDVIHTGA